MGVYRSQCLPSAAFPRKIGYFVCVFCSYFTCMANKQWWRCQQRAATTKTTTQTVATTMRKKSSHLQSIQVIVNYKLSFALKRALLLTRPPHFFYIIYIYVYVISYTNALTAIPKPPLNFVKFSSFTRFRFMLLYKTRVYKRHIQRRTNTLSSTHISHFLPSVASWSIIYCH